jgi:predicted AAA+ superfamily ATPase
LYSNEFSPLRLGYESRGVRDMEKNILFGGFPENLPSPRFLEKPLLKIYEGFQIRDIIFQFRSPLKFLG